jgi:hypothetical protein
MDKPIAWYDPSNGMVSTDQDCSLFTPLGQVWALYPEREWVGLTDEEMLTLEETTTCTKDESWLRNLTRAIEAKLKEKNNG